MAEGPQKHTRELGIELLTDLLLFLYPYGADQMGLPHNFWLGLGCLAVGTAIAIRMFWIFPMWENALSKKTKTVISVVLVGVFVSMFYKPVLTAYSKKDSPALDQQTENIPNRPW